MGRVSQAEAIETRLLLEAIYEGYGYDFRGYAPESMSRRIRAALAKSGMAHCGELQHRLLVEPEVFARLFEAVHEGVYIGLLTDDGNETLSANVGAATGATILDGQGTGTILNDDGPTLAIGDAAITEGHAGTKYLNFTVTLSEAAPGPAVAAAST